MPYGACRITCWISSPCASSPSSSYAGCGAGSIRLCFLDSRQSRELHAYHWLESPERPGQLVGISQNGGLSFCLVRVWSQEWPF